MLVLSECSLGPLGYELHIFAMAKRFEQYFGACRFGGLCKKELLLFSYHKVGTKLEPQIRKCFEMVESILGFGRIGGTVEVPQ